MAGLVLRRYGTLVEVSPDGFSALPQDIINLLVPHLSYTHLERVNPGDDDAWDHITGERRHVRTIVRRLYKLDSKTRLVTGYGFIPKIIRVLKENSFKVRLIDLTPPPERPRRFEALWERLDDHRLRPRQRECLTAIARAQGGIIDAVTGFGKTHILVFLGLIFPYAKIDIICKRKDIVQKMVRRLRQFLPSVGQVGGGKKQFGKRITVYVAASAHYSDGDADFLFCDEGHELMSEVHSATISERYRFSRNFTFTASPEGRYDNADVKLEMMFGPIIFRLTYPEAVRLGLVVPIKIKWLPIQSTFNPAGEYSETVSRKRWGIWRNEFRNKAIADEAREYGDDQVLILVETVDHAVHLKQFLPEFDMCYADMDQDRLERYIRNRMLPEDYEPMTPERREAMTLGFETGQLKKVIATDVWGTGVDFEELAVLIRADARGSDILDTQYPGRVSRIVTSGADKPYGLVIDCMDHFDKSFKRTSQSRSRNYKKKEWEQLGLSTPRSTTRKRRSACQS